MIPVEPQEGGKADERRALVTLQEVLTLGDPVRQERSLLRDISTPIPCGPLRPGEGRGETIGVAEPILGPPLGVAEQIGVDPKDVPDLQVQDTDSGVGPHLLGRGIAAVVLLEHLQRLAVLLNSLTTD